MGARNAGTQTPGINPATPAVDTHIPMQAPHPGPVHANAAHSKAQHAAPATGPASTPARKYEKTRTRPIIVIFAFIFVSELINRNFFCFYSEIRQFIIIGRALFLDLFQSKKKAKIDSSGGSYIVSAKKTTSHFVEKNESFLFFQV